MNDLISRQQAIDALTEYGNGRAVFISVGEAVIRIEQLPSAQPTFDARDTQYNLPIGTDLISRRAMIEAIENNDNFVGGSYDIIKVVKSLPPAEPQIIRCKDCKYWIPYDWMFSEVWQSKNIADYPEDEIGCACSDMAMKANDFCSRGERRTE
ncbi:MAG TPA: hypothetical protein DCX23_00420 [Lachnospiraceae bacterium]|nr:hypothetical protein [Lachnospiraceae bacterium]